MSLLILKSGILDTIQDTGRYGYARWGINPGGAMDKYAAQVANALVGNEPHDGVIEIHFPAPEILFQQDALIGLAGADFTPYINDIEVPVWKPFVVRDASVLSFYKKRKGARCYLSVQGGFNLVPWLGSVSTNVKTQTGGWRGSALKKGDSIPFKKGAESFMFRDVGQNPFLFPWSVNAHDVYQNLNELFFMEGNEWNWLTEEAKDKILSTEFVIDSSSDRMGYYLKHEPLPFQNKHELLSSGVSFGTIQRLPNGSLVVLMADHQTTGGYPRIGHIITAHLPKLAQLGANDVFCLKKISGSTAEKMLFSQQQDVEKVTKSLGHNLRSWR